MNTKRIFSTGLLLALTLLIAFGGVWQSASAGSKGVFPLEAQETIQLGKQGVYASNIPVGVTHVYAATIHEPLPPRFNHDVDITYRSPPMEVRFLNGNGGSVQDISALVYVFFNIGKAERKLWMESGRDSVSIWYANEYTGKWERCPTFFVDENRDNGGYDRLTCIAPGSGYYVLGHVDFDELLFNPYTHNNELVIDFPSKFIPE
jgi:hypothetical protein